MIFRYYINQFIKRWRTENKGLVLLYAAQHLLEITIGKWWRRLVKAPLMARYSFLGEDVIIEKLLDCPAKEVFYLDVGANHPVVESNSYRFYRKGARGVVVEPNPRLAGLHKVLRPGDITLNLGLGSSSGPLRFFEFENDVLSTFSPERASDVKSKGVRLIAEYALEVQTLAWVFAKYAGPREINYLSIDAEGFDLQILKGNDWSKFRPKVILIELEDQEGITAYLNSVGYQAVRLTSHYGRVVNGIFVDRVGQQSSTMRLGVSP